MNKLRKLSSSTKRLVLLTLATAALAIPAAAISKPCTQWNVTCPDGTDTGAEVCCTSGQSSYAECDCLSWSQTGGWSDCELVTACY